MSIDFASPLPAREGPGVGIGASASTANAPSGSLRSQPAPNPSLAGRGVSSDTSRLGSRENLDRAGTQFEAVFTRMMLSSMRKTKLADTLFESKALDTFRDMQDSQVADAMAQHAPMGIGRAVTDFLARSQKELAQNDLAPKADLNPGGASARES